MFSFLDGISQSVFLKGNNLITDLMTEIAMFNCFFCFLLFFFVYYFHERSHTGKKPRHAKFWCNGKVFYYKAGVLF